MNTMKEQTIEQIAERVWRELNNSNIIPGDSMHAEFARRVVAAWCAQAEIARYEVKIRIGGGISAWMVPNQSYSDVVDARPLYTRPAPPQSCTESESESIISSIGEAAE